MSEYYLTDKGEDYLQKILERGNTEFETTREISILLEVKASALDEDFLDFIQKSEPLRKTFRGLFEAGYIEEAN